MARLQVLPGKGQQATILTPPAGARLLAVARKSKPVVVVAKVDRLFRSVDDAAQTIADFGRVVDSGKNRLIRP